MSDESICHMLMRAHPELADAVDTPLDSSSVVGLLRLRASTSAEQPALWQLTPQGTWASNTWGEYLQAVSAVATGFAQLGLQRGERVGIMAPSCREWDYAQLGAMAAGGVAVGLDVHAVDEHLQKMALDCELAGVVLSHPAMLERLGEAVRRRLRFVVILQASAPREFVAFDKLLRTPVLGNSWDKSHPGDIAAVVFSSGTTGAPKGIAYSHRQMCQAVASIVSAHPTMCEGTRLACWLPLANLFQRMINFCAIYRGGQTFYVEDPRSLMQHVREIAPHVLIGVPRFFEKLYAGMQDALARKPLWQRSLARWALAVGDRYATAQRNAVSVSPWAKLQWRVADRLVLRQLRAVLGPNMRYVCSGSAPMPAWLLERFHAMGVLVLEGYGMSENVIMVALNQADRYRFGTVGQALPGCEVKLAPDGELLVRGPGVFHGYLGGERAESLDEQGFLASGDYASIDADGYIRLLGRKSEIFKTSTGRRVAPFAVETCLRQIPLVDEAVVFGAQRPQPVALLTVGGAAWLLGPQNLAAALRAEAQQVLASLPSYLRPAGFLVSMQPLSVAQGELTSNMKLRRPRIAQTHTVQLHELYTRLDRAEGAAFEGLSADGLFVLCSL